MSRESIKNDVILNLSAGQILTDVKEQCWILGKPVGHGGYREIYTASIECPILECPSAEYAIKLDYERGNLFEEINCYRQLGTTEKIEEWREKWKLEFLGMPKLISYGLSKVNGIGYRFLVMERYGDNLEKLWRENGKIFSAKTVVNLAVQMIDILEYIHHFSHLHGDIKASNIVVDAKSCDRVYLIDYGSAKLHSIDDKHACNKPHIGTLQITSCDAHLDRLSRRADLESLACTLMKWSSGKLPWETDVELKDKEAIQTKKIKYLDDFGRLFDECYENSTPCPGLRELFGYILALRFEEAPNYDSCRRFLKEGLAKAGIKNNGKLDLKLTIISDKPNLKKRFADDSPQVGIRRILRRKRTRSVDSLSIHTATCV